MSNTKNNRAWCFDTPAWYDHAKENEENEWWDPERREWRPMGTLRITLAERRQACHAQAFSQWASHELAESAPQRGYEACRWAVMRLVAAWSEYGYTKLEDMILDAWYSGAHITDEELAEEARAFGYSRIAEILDPVGEQDEEDGGITSMHKHVHW
jgi:hypothetical protein